MSSVYSELLATMSGDTTVSALITDEERRTFNSFDFLEALWDRFSYQSFDLRAARKVVNVNNANVRTQLVALAIAVASKGTKKTASETFKMGKVSFSASSVKYIDLNGTEHNLETGRVVGSKSKLSLGRLPHVFAMEVFLSSFKSNRMSYVMSQDATIDRRLCFSGMAGLPWLEDYKNLVESAVEELAIAYATDRLTKLKTDELREEAQNEILEKTRQIFAATWAGRWADSDTLPLVNALGLDCFDQSRFGDGKPIAPVRPRSSGSRARNQMESFPTPENRSETTKDKKPKKTEKVAETEVSLPPSGFGKEEASS